MKMRRIRRFGEFNVIKVDLSAKKSIKVKVRPEVNLENHKTSANMVIRAGLYLQAMKEVKQENIVRLSWLPSDVSDQQIIETMEMFWRVTKPPTDSKFIMNELTKRFRNVFNNDKNVEVLVERNNHTLKLQTKKSKSGIEVNNFHAPAVSELSKITLERLLPRNASLKTRLPR